MEMKADEILGRICFLGKLTEYRAPKWKKGTEWKPKDRYHLMMANSFFKPNTKTGTACDCARVLLLLPHPLPTH